MASQKLAARRILAPPDGVVADPQLESEFFQALRLPNGTYKATRAGRLRDLDALLLRHLGSGPGLQLLEAGGSTGVTALEWLQELEAAGYEPTLTLADIALQARLVRCGPLDLLVQPDGKLLQFAGFGRTAFRPDPLQSGLRPACVAGAIRFLELACGTWRGISPDSAAPVALITPALVGRPGVTLVEWDLFKQRADWSSSFDVVRVANLLNRAYFTEEQLHSLGSNLSGWVRDSGLLVVCRTHASGLNHASVIRVPPRGNGTAEVVARLGEGSEVEDIVLRSISAWRR